MSAGNAGLTLIESLVAIVVGAAAMSTVASLVSGFAAHRQHVASDVAEAVEAKAFARSLDRMSGALAGPGVTRDGEALRFVTFGMPRSLPTEEPSVIVLRREADRLVLTLDGPNDAARRPITLLSKLETIEFERVGTPASEPPIVTVRPIPILIARWRSRGGSLRMHASRLERWIETSCVRDDRPRRCRDEGLP